MLYPRYINMLRRSGSLLLRRGIAIDRAFLPASFRSHGLALFKFSSEKGAMLGTVAGMTLPALVGTSDASANEVFREAISYATDLNVFVRMGAGTLLGFGAGGATAVAVIAGIRAGAGACAAAGYGIRTIGDQQFVRAVRREVAQLNRPSPR